MDSPSRASTPQFEANTTTITDSSSDRNNGAVPRSDSPLNSSDEAVETEIAPQATLSAKGETIMPLADSPSVPTDGMLKGEMVVEQSPFMRIPAELRIPIYKLLVLSHPAKVVECAHIACTDGSEFLASTCKPVSSQIRTFKCEDCSDIGPFRGQDVHLEILRISRQIYHEASAVLYENVQVKAAAGPWGDSPEYPSASLAPHIRHLCWTVPCTDQTLLRMIAQIKNHLPNFPNLRVVRLHQDVDLTIGWSTRLDNTTLDLLTQFGDQVEFVLDVHILSAWAQGFDNEGWADGIDSRDGFEERGKELDAQAAEMRLQLTTDLSEAFKRKGKVLKVREEGKVEADVSKDQQDGMTKPEVAEDQQDGMMDAEVAEDQQEG